jgi:ABC-type nitrate/sulfonate/bicarbonate transport system substrate-binding protein
MKKFSLLVLLWMLPALLFSCGKKDTNPDAPQSPEKITVVLDWTPNTNHTGLYVAQEKGWFAEAGLDVAIEQPPESGADALVAAGKADFGITAQDTLAPAWLADTPLPVTAVAAVVNHNTSGLICAGTEIRSFKDLEGKKYATWDNPTELAIIEHVMRAQGGDFSKLELIPSTVTDVLTAIQSDIDAVWIFEGWDKVAADLKSIPHSYLSFAAVSPVLDYYTPMLIAGDAFLKERPETAKKFLAALSKGYAYAAKNPAESAQILLQAAPELGAELVNASQEFLSAQYMAEGESWGYIDPQRWSGFYHWLYENGLTEKDLGAFGFTNEFLPIIRD